MATDAEQAIQAAVERGAIRPERAGHYRALFAEGVDPGVLDDLVAARPPITASVMLGDRDPVTGQRVARSVGVAAAAPAGANPAWYAVNPLLDEMRASRPALVSAAEAEGPAPKLFYEFDADLPPFTSSGLDPAVLASLPWPVRRAAAEAPDLAMVYDLATTDDATLSDLRFSRHNQPYVAEFSAWLAGPVRNSVEAQLAEAGQRPGSSPARHPATGRFTASGPGARDDLSDLAGDYVGQRLHDELFGPS
jgi:hypothetical protein